MQRDQRLGEGQGNHSIQQEVILELRSEGPQGRLTRGTRDPGHRLEMSGHWGG